MGNKLWDKTIGGSQGDAVHQICQVSDNSIIIIGISNSPVSGEKTQAPIGANDVWLVKVDTNGNIIWDKTYGGNDIETGASLCYKQNSLYISCYSFSGISGTKTEPCIGNCDYWVLKLDVEGNKIWDKTIGGTSNEIPNSIFISTDNELLIAGSSSSNISGNKTENSYGLSDFWVVALDTNSNIKWQKTIGGSDYDGCYDLLELANNNYMLFGYSSSGISGLKTDACRGQQDYWIVEIANDYGVHDNIKNDLKISPNPFSQSTQITLNKTYQNIALAVYDIQGKQVAQQHYTNCSQIQLNRNLLTNGLYFVKLTLDDKAVETVKVVVGD